MRCTLQAVLCWSWSVLVVTITKVIICIVTGVANPPTLHDTIRLTPCRLALRSLLPFYVCSALPETRHAPLPSGRGGTLQRYAWTRVSFRTTRGPSSLVNTRPGYSSKTLNLLRRRRVRAHHSSPLRRHHGHPRHLRSFHRFFARASRIAACASRNYRRHF